MKKLLLPFILLFTIPFNTSCIKEITFTVSVDYADPEEKHCHWDEPGIAYISRDYSLRFYDDPKWKLEQDENSFQIEAGFKQLYQPFCWTYVDHVLVIKGQFVTNNIKILVTSFEEEEFHEQK